MRRPGRGLRRRPGAECPHRALAVTQPLLAEILDRCIDAAGEQIAHLGRYYGFARVGELGEAGGHIYAVTEHVEGLDDDIRDVDAYAHAERRRSEVDIES